MSMGSVIGMNMPLPGVPIYSKDPLTSSNESKREGATQLAEEYLHKQIGTDAQAQGDKEVRPFHELH